MATSLMNNQSFRMNKITRELNMVINEFEEFEIEAMKHLGNDSLQNMRILEGLSLIDQLSIMDLVKIMSTV